jgi:hypothetical protein
MLTLLVSSEPQVHAPDISFAWLGMMNIPLIGLDDGIAFDLVSVFHDVVFRIDPRLSLFIGAARHIFDNLPRLPRSRDPERRPKINQTGHELHLLERCVKGTVAIRK